MIRKTVVINESIIDNINSLAKRESRDFSGALRYALRIGLLSIENPDLTMNEIRDIIEAAVDNDEGRVYDFDINRL